MRGGAATSSLSWHEGCPGGGGGGGGTVARRVAHDVALLLL